MGFIEDAKDKISDAVEAIEEKVQDLPVVGGTAEKLANKLEGALGDEEAAKQ